jgi:hypothetical protein
MGCVVYGIQLGWGCVVCELICSTPSGFSSGCCSEWGLSDLAQVRKWWRTFVNSVVHCLLLRNWWGGDSLKS